MAKAIHWPAPFRDEVLAEDCTGLRCAFRLGDLYYQNHYWVADEIVDIRVDHRKVRKGIVKGELKQCRIEALTAEDLACQKEGLRSIPAIVSYLQETYQQPVDEKTWVTVVYYKNLPVDPDEME